MQRPAAAVTPGVRILIVEDNPLAGRQVLLALEELGYRPLPPCRTGEEAVARAMQERPELILMDIMLGPGIDGIEAAAQVWEQADIPVVFLTALDDVDTLRRAAIGRPFGYLIKPASGPELRAAVEIAVARHGDQDRLRKEAAFARAVLGSIDQPVVAVDNAASLVFINDAAKAWADPRAQAFPGAAVESVLVVESPGRPQVLSSAIHRAVSMGSPIRLPRRTSIRRREGDVPIAGVVTPLQEPVQGAVFLFRELRAEQRSPSLEADAVEVAHQMRQAARETV